MNKDELKKIISEFSPKVLCGGLEGLFVSDIYESVEITIKFNKKRAAENQEAGENIAQLPKV